MALNCSSRSLLLGDDSAGKMFGCGCWSEEASPLSSCGISSLWWDELNLEEEEEEVDEEAEESDPIARLPSDPFEMNLHATSAMAALAWCIEDFRARSGAQPFESGGNNDLFLNLLNHAFIAFAPNPLIDGDMGFSEGSFGSGGSSGCDSNQFSWLSPNTSCSQPGVFVENPPSSRPQSVVLAYCDAACSGFAEDPSSSQNAALACCDAVSAASSRFAEGSSSTQDAVLACYDGVGAAPRQERNDAHGQGGNDAHPGMFFAISYLGLGDILSCENVCKSLRSAIRSENYSWKCIHINSQLGEKISDTDLLRLTQKTPGDLQCLSLMRCKHITDQGLKAVLRSNPQLIKLGIFGNVRITHQGLDNLRSFNVEPNIGLKKLRIANLATLSKVQYGELLSLLKIDEGLALHKQEPRIFHADCFSSDNHGGYAPDGFLPDLHDGYALDIERCPICENYKLVYDCPAEGCNDSGSSKCRGCLVCIQRCLRCGRCINNEYEETFSLDNLCRSCQVNGDVAGK